MKVLKKLILPLLKNESIKKINFALLLKNDSLWLAMKVEYSVNSWLINRLIIRLYDKTIFIRLQLDLIYSRPIIIY